MNLPKYKITSSHDYLSYEFYSYGPMGRIKKIVRYSFVNEQGKTFVNLGFGDWNESKQRVDDFSRSNNKDRDKILATVAATVVKFSARYPDLPIFAKGSTPARTRLYQMAIAANWKEISILLEVYGKTGDHWEPFQKKANYQGFLAIRKKS